MKKFFLIILVPFIFGSCTNVANETNTNESRTISLNINNVNQFFTLQIKEKGPSPVVVRTMEYELSIQLIGNYSLYTDVKFTVLVRGNYGTGTTDHVSAKKNMTMKKENNHLSEKGTVLFFKDLDEIGYISWSCSFSKVSGSLISN